MGSVCSIQMPCSCAAEQSVPIPQTETNNEVMQSLHHEEQHQQQLLQQGLSQIEAETTQVDELRSDTSQETEKSSRQEQVTTIEVMQSFQDAEPQRQKLLQQGLSETESETGEVDELRSDNSQRYEAIVGMESFLQEVCDCLLDEQVMVLSINGYQGVGKTTLMTIYNKFRSTPNDFDVVIWVTDDSELERNQANIWKQLGIYDSQWEKKSSHEKATDIFNVLSQKRFLLFLDEVIIRSDLTKVGAPLRRSEKRSKIVLIITDDESMGTEMNAEKQITVPIFTKIDAWKLFQKKVGEELLCLDPSMPRIAKDIVRKLAYPPVILNVVASSMAKKKTVQEWREVHEILPSRDEDYIPFILKLINDNLPNERVKSCFIYCAILLPASKILKDDLVSYWICESFWEDYDSGVDVEDNEGYQIIDTLVDACLLEDEGNYVSMFPFLWAMVLEFVSRRQLENIFVGAGDEFVGGEWQEKGISLFGNSIVNLREVPVCPNLFLCHNRRLTMIVDGFFQLMPALTILDLSNTSINELPSEISQLVSLQYLNVSQTWIEQLPDEVSLLSRLKCLKLEYNGLLRFISRQVISSLLMLQILKLFSCGVSLVQSEDNILSYGNEHLNELQGLEYLQTLSITITSSRALQSLFNIPKSRTCTKALSLKCFWGTKSLDISLLADIKDLQMLEVYHIDDLEELNVDLRTKETEIQEFNSLHNSAIPRKRSFNNLKELMVEKCFHLRELTWVILAPNLRVLKVVDCQEMEEIISINKLDEISNVICNPFFNLEVIALENLPKLKSIYWSALPFLCLEKIKIVDCPLLKRLPLNSNSAMGKVVLFHAKEDWWNGIDWEDDATRIAFIRSFIKVR